MSDFVRSLKEPIPEGDIFHPILYNRHSRVHYIVAGAFFNDLVRKPQLCLFPEREKHYEVLLGTWDEDQQKLYISDRRYEHTKNNGRLSSVQREVLQIHYISHFIHELIICKPQIVKPINKLL